MAKIKVQETEVTVVSINNTDYISLTDIARYKSEEPFIVVVNWMRNRNTIEYLGIWESLYNLNFKPIEFDRFRKEAGLNAFTLSPQKWIESTNAIGIISKSGRYGGTFAHKDIAFKFASWISVEFELYIIKEFQRLKEHEQQQLGWSAKRELSKINYHIHTDAVKHNLSTNLKAIYCVFFLEFSRFTPLNLAYCFTQTLRMVVFCPFYSFHQWTTY